MNQINYFTVSNSKYFMKKLSVFILVSIFFLPAFAQSSKFDHKKAFDPQFYPYPGTELRSASGQPGPKYWQNRADYSIVAVLDTSIHALRSSVEISYTNNSPDELGFLWIHMDQNIYKQNSRASATTTQ